MELGVKKLKDFRNNGSLDIKLLMADSVNIPCSSSLSSFTYFPLNVIHKLFVYSKLSAVQVELLTKTSGSKHVSC